MELSPSPRVLLESFTSWCVQALFRFTSAHCRAPEAMKSDWGCGSGSQWIKVQFQNVFKASFFKNSVLQLKYQNFACWAMATALIHIGFLWKHMFYIGEIVFAKGNCNLKFCSVFPSGGFLKDVFFLGKRGFCLRKCLLCYNSSLLTNPTVGFTWLLQSELWVWQHPVPVEHPISILQFHRN